MVEFFVTILLAIGQFTPMFIDAQNENSKRYALLEEDGGVVYLYLSVPGEPRPEKDIVVFSTGLLVTEQEASEAARKGNPPPLSKRVATPDGVIKSFKETEFSFQWSTDGESVAVLRSGRPLAMIVSGSNRGYSRALKEFGGYGKPWDQTVFESFFGK